MRNFNNVGIVECLKEIFYETTKKHETDFKFDILRIFSEAKKAENEGAPRHLLWMAKQNGTWCFPEGNVYIEGTPERKFWLGYQSEASYIKAFAVEINGIRDNSAVGNVYELAYEEHVKEVQGYYFVPCSIDIELKNGDHVCVPIDKFNFYTIQLELESISSMSYVFKEDTYKYLELLKEIRQLRHVLSNPSNDDLS